MESAAWQRANLLISQGRHDLAEVELNRVLAADPDFGPAHAMLAQVHAQNGDLDRALASATRAVGLGPDEPFVHHVLAVVYWRREEYREAESAIARAIELEPADPDHHAMRGQILLTQKRWQEALTAVETGLQLDAENVDCVNIRSMALVKLGRRDDAVDTLDAALARDPDNPYTHQARGFALLHRGEHKAALHHFQEALRRDPTLDASRAGLVEALKARNPVYRLLLGWMLWMERFSAGRQQQILIGAWLLFIVSRHVLESAGHEGAASVLGSIWLGVVMFTFCGVPIFNLLLLLHPLGRHALDPRSRRDAVLLGCALLLLAGIGCYAWLGPLSWPRFATLVLLFWLLPVAGIGAVGDGWPRRLLQMFVLAGFVVVAVWAVAMHRLDTGPELDPDFAERWPMSWFGALMLAPALSSWFVVFAPKTRRPARRRR